MTTEEKAKKYDEIVTYLWHHAVEGSLLTSSMSAAVIRVLKIEGPNGEDPESA